MLFARLTPRPDARWLQNIKRRFTKSWDRLFKEVNKTGTSGKALVDHLIAMLVKFTELAEDVVIKTTSEAEGNAIVALFKKSRAKDTEWVHWFMYLKYGLYACGGGECRDAMLHSYVHKAVTQPARTKAQARTEQQHLSRAAMSVRAHDTQKARDHQKKVIEAKAKAIAKAGKSSQHAHAAVNAHKNMLHEHEMKLSVYDTQLQDLHRELQMYAEEPDLAKECRERWLAMVKQKREWLRKNPPPTLQQAKAVLNEEEEEAEVEAEEEEEEEAEHGVEEGQEEQVEEEEGNEDEGEDLFPDHEEEMEDNEEEVTSPLSPPPPKRPTPAKSKQTWKRSRLTESEAGQGGGEKCAYALDTCLITQHQCLSWRLKQTGCTKLVCTVCAARINGDNPMHGHWCPAHLSLM